MPKIAYQRWNPQRATLQMVQRAVQIIDRYQAAGYSLTLRQLYYQMVSTYPNEFPNNVKQYSKLGDAISNARLAGMIDWEAIEDRMRVTHAMPHWSNPGDVINSAAESYGIDKWAGQDYRIIVMVEKDALQGVIERPCRDLDVQWLACRGYMSQTEMWQTAMRIKANDRRGHLRTVILHFGDHDPSGIDMTRDIRERLGVFGVEHLVLVDRIALNMDQVEQYQPPPNPAKQTDSRFADYEIKFGDESWELDALEPQVLDGLIRTEIAKYLDVRKWADLYRRQETDRMRLRQAARYWSDIDAHVSDEYGDERYAESDARVMDAVNMDSYVDASDDEGDADDDE